MTQSRLAVLSLLWLIGAVCGCSGSTSPSDQPADPQCQGDPKTTVCSACEYRHSTPVCRNGVWDCGQRAHIDCGTCKGMTSGTFGPNCEVQCPKVECNDAGGAGGSTGGSAGSAGSGPQCQGDPKTTVCSACEYRLNTPVCKDGTWDCGYPSHVDCMTCKGMTSGTFGPNCEVVCPQIECTDAGPDADDASPSVDAGGD